MSIPDGHYVREGLIGERVHYYGASFFYDSVDTFLRKLSIEYLRVAWEEVASSLDRYGLRPPDLSWG